MRPVLLLCGLVLLLSGCALDPGSLALIPTPEPVHIPPRYAQHLNVLKYYDSVPVQAISEQCEDLTVLSLEQLQNDKWLQLWAMSAMDRDGSLELKRTLEKGQIPDEEFWVEDHYIAVKYMNAFETADLKCNENRMEMASLVEFFAEKVGEFENVQYPRLTIVYQLWDADIPHCHAYLDSLPIWHDFNFCFAGDCLKEGMTEAQKLMDESEELQWCDLMKTLAPTPSS